MSFLRVHFFSAKRLNFFFPRLSCYHILFTRERTSFFSATTTRSKKKNNNNNNMRRRPRKNPHPKRAVNARTVLKGRGKEEPLVFVCSRIPDDDVEANHQIQKEEEEEEGEDEDVKQLWRIMCVPCDDVVEQKQTRKDAKGVKRKRGQHECDVCGKVFGTKVYVTGRINDVY